MVLSCHFVRPFIGRTVGGPLRWPLTPHMPTQRIQTTWGPRSPCSVTSTATAAALLSSHEILVASCMDQLDYTAKQFTIIIRPILNHQLQTANLNNYLNWWCDFVLQIWHWINAENYCSWVTCYIGIMKCLPFYLFIIKFNVSKWYYNYAILYFTCLGKWCFGC